MDIHISEIVKNLATTVAIVLAGLWAIWRWGFSELLRRQKEMLSIDMRIHPAVNRLGYGRAVVTIDALCRNRGSILAKIDTQSTTVAVYALEPGQDIGELSIQALGKPKYIRRPLERHLRSQIEPNTEILYSAHFVLDSGTTYAIRWQLVKLSKSNLLRRLLGKDKSQEIESWTCDVVLQPLSYIAADALS